MPAPSGRIDGSGSSPIATRIASASIVASEPGTGTQVARPCSTAPVGACSMIPTARTAPSVPSTSVTVAPIRKAIPSRLAASTSSAWAGISLNPRR